jgi:D-serine deaminase-like pyridoxal phosphate-dependent protein
MNAAAMTVHDESQIPTPALIVDSNVVDRNLSRMAKYCAEHRLLLRPHAKTHKSREMTRRQIAHGAVGISVAKIGEAEALADSAPAFFIAYPYVDGDKAARIAELARHKSVMVAVDSTLAIDVIATAAQVAAVAIGILVDLDIGFHRTGVQTAAESIELARQVAKKPSLQLHGLFAFAGHVNGKPPDQIAQLKQISSQLREAIDAWKHDGHDPTIVSGGSTPTAYNSQHVPEFTEIRPGNFIYNDSNGFRNNWCALEDCAACVVVTVVSNAVLGKCVIDGGSKTFSSDRLALNPDKGGFGFIREFPNAKIVRLSEEHGEVDLSECPEHPRLGQRLHVIPNHMCPCVNLQDTFWLKMEDRRLEQMPVDARGRLS